MAIERMQRRLAAILTADIVGYSRLMEADEVVALATLKDYRNSVIDPLLGAYDGRVVKLMGDGTLAEFASVVDAVECAVEMQRLMSDKNAAAPSGRSLELRIGINLGDVIPDGDDIYGEGINLAARLESLAEPGGICISGTVHDAIGRDLAARFEFVGEQVVKNIEKPVRTYRHVECAEPSFAACSKSAEQVPTHQQSIPSLALKPFENLSNDPEQGRFVDALSNGILVALTRLPGLILVQDESPQLAQSKAMTEQEIAGQFSVKYLLKGDLRKLGDRARVSIQLMDVSTGQYLWAEKFDWSFSGSKDLFSLQDEIIEQVVTSLDVKLLSSEAARLVRGSLTNPVARDTYARGEYEFWSAQSNLELHNAQDLLEQTIRLEPTASVGYATVALAYWVEALSADGERLAEVQALAERRSREAIELDDVTGYPRLVLAHLHLIRREFDDAHREAGCAISARPSCPAAYALKASVLNYLGEFNEALEHAEFAMRLTPVHPPMYPATLASALYSSGRYHEAIAAATSALSGDQSSVHVYVILVASYLAVGKSEEARRIAAKLRQLKPDFNFSSFGASQPYKDRSHLEHLLEQLRQAGFD
ncbi:adenylate/guanylate cyclase domain-containing protein [Ruegeria sp. SCP11]|uniref:adenylate/guanylate cyclase domain-containing protein n=1 Tax=Ruegeria sp. SCP11 TaxID=3141378 RepID=UPI003335529F